MMDQSNSCLSLRSDWVFNFKPRRMQNKKNLCKLDGDFLQTNYRGKGPLAQSVVIIQYGATEENMS
ncbi:hypothetical protein QQP08_019362 [Theobroma cacao]|nr:hypothetical protein QQP08_019362 [Theobroma cacao]